MAINSPGVFLALKLKFNVAILGLLTHSTFGILFDTQCSTLHLDHTSRFNKTSLKREINIFIVNSTIHNRSVSHACLP